jgi:hypothetical protein
VGPEQITRFVEDQGVTGLTEQEFAVGEGEGALSGGNGQAGQGGNEAGGLGWIWQAVGVGVLVFSATGLFTHLQFALNRAWGAEPIRGAAAS